MNTTFPVTLPKKRLEQMMCNGVRCTEVRQSETLLDHVVADIIVPTPSAFQEILFSDDAYVMEITKSKMRA